MVGNNNSNPTTVDSIDFITYNPQEPRTRFGEISDQLEILGAVSSSTRGVLFCHGGTKPGVGRGESN